MRIRKSIRVYAFCLVIGIVSNAWSTPPLQGQRPTTFPNLPQLTDSTLLFTQDSAAHQSYKFTLGKLKSFINNNTCLDSSFANINDCIPQKQIKDGDSIYYYNTISEIFGDTSGTIEFCNAISEFPNLTSGAFLVDGNTFNVDSGMYCSTGFQGGYSFSQDFPVDVRLCPNGYISEIRVKAFISNYEISGDGEEPGLAVLALNVNGENVKTSNSWGGDTPETISILGDFGDIENYEFIYKNLQSSTINTVRATFMWLNGASFHLDGLKVTYKIANCPCYQQFLTTDSLGCMKLDSVILPEPFVLQATNGLSLQDENTVKLGGTMTQQITTLNGNGNQIDFNGFNNIRLNSYYYDENNPNMYYTADFYQSGYYSRQQVMSGDNSNNQDESTSYNISSNNLSQYHTYYDNTNSITKYSQSQLSENIYQSASYNDNNNSISNYSSSQLSPDGFYLNSNSNTNQYSSHTLSAQNITFNTYDSTNNFTNYNQTQSEIGIKASDYNLSGITQFKLTPLAVYLQTQKIYSSNATAGQVLTLKDANTGEVEFEDLVSIIDSLNNLDTSNCSNSTNGLHKDSCYIKLGGELTESTTINTNSNEFSIWNGSVPFNNGLVFNNYGSNNTGIVSFINGYDRIASLYSGKNISNNNLTVALEVTDNVLGNYKGLGAILDSSNNKLSFAFNTHKDSLNSEATVDFDYNDNILLYLQQHLGYGKIGYHGSSLLRAQNNLGQDFLDVTTDGKIKIIANTDNTATQVLAKDSSGLSVWRDINTIKPYSYTPTSSSDTYGNIGDIAFDTDYIYMRTSSGWRRTALSTW